MRQVALILERDQALCEQAATEFRRLGYRVVSACRGEDGLDVIHRIHPHIIVIGGLDGDVSRLDFITLIQYVMGESPPRVVIIDDQDDLNDLKSARVQVERQLSLLAFPGMLQ